jgi:multicomponent Na+:H+ antiporter subunit A
MILLSSILLLAVAALCLGASRVVPTRTLGLVAAGATLLSAVPLVAARQPGTATSEVVLRWATLDPLSVYLHLSITPQNQLLALVLLFGGTLSLYTLAVALSSSVRGFGALFAYALLAIVAVLVGLSSTSMLVPFAWAVAVLSAYGMVRSSGVLAQSSEVHQGVAYGLVASLLLSGGMLAAHSYLVEGVFPSALAAICIVLACLVLVGGAPFHATFDEMVMVPSAPGGLLFGMVFPILALGTLLNLVGQLPPILSSTLHVLPLSWQAGLCVVGVAVMLVCAIAALHEHHLRRILAWHVSAQAGLVMVALGVEGPLAAVAAPSLVLNLVLTTLAGSLAVAALKHLTGNDDFTQDFSGKQQPRALLKVAGFVWACAGLSALGVPPFWGFWGRYWLLTALAEHRLWVVPLVFAASALAALSYLVPLARFWWAGGTIKSDGAGLVGQKKGPERVSLSSPANPLMGVLGLAPLLVAGVAPQLAWSGWLQFLPRGPVLLPVSPVVQAGVGVTAIVAGVVVVVLWRMRWVRHSPSDEDMQPVILAPDTLARSMAFPSWLGRPESLLQVVWQGLLRLQQGVNLSLIPFEQRYYLVGVLMALISLILMMALS